MILRSENDCAMRVERGVSSKLGGGLLDIIPSVTLFRFNSTD
jgi:hypothetical protein